MTNSIVNTTELRCRHIADILVSLASGTSNHWTSQPAKNEGYLSMN